MLQSHQRSKKVMVDTKSKDASASAAVGMASKTAHESASDWYVLGVTDYAADGGKAADTHVEVTVHPGDIRYRSKPGKADLHLYVPKSATYASVEVMKDTFCSDETLLSYELKLTDKSSWCADSADLTRRGGCAFHKKTTKKQWYWEWTRKCYRWVGCFNVPSLEHRHIVDEEVTGYLVTGAALEDQVEYLHKEKGIAVKYDDFEATKAKFAQARIRADQIASEMAYAKTGSVFPRDLHGIWWMDQRGVNVPIEGYPGYEQVCSTAADEIVMSLGGADWDPVTKCATGVSLKTGSPLKGHWTFTDTTGQGSETWESSLKSSSLTGDFCYGEGKDDEINVITRISVNRILKRQLPTEFVDFMKGLGLLDSAGWVSTPKEILTLKMKKTGWGWDRVSFTIATTFGKVFMEHFGDILEKAGFKPRFPGTCHYPVFQVIDGDGNPTKYFSAFLKWAEKQTTCPGGESTFECMPNKGNGTIMLPRMVA